METVIVFNFWGSNEQPITKTLVDYWDMLNFYDKEKDYPADINIKYEDKEPGGILQHNGFLIENYKQWKPKFDKKLEELKEKI